MQLFKSRHSTRPFTIALFVKYFVSITIKNEFKLSCLTANDFPKNEDLSTRDCVGPARMYKRLSETRSSKWSDRVPPRESLFKTLVSRERAPASMSLVMLISPLTLAARYNARSRGISIPHKLISHVALSTRSAVNLHGIKGWRRGEKCEWKRSSSEREN